MSRLSSVLPNHSGFQNKDYFGYPLSTSPPDLDDDDDNHLDRYSNHYLHDKSANNTSNTTLRHPNPSLLPQYDFGGFCAPSSLRKLAMISRLVAAASNTAPSSPNLASNGPNGLVNRTIPRHALLPPPATHHSFGIALKALPHDVDDGSQPSTGPPSVTLETPYSRSMPSTAPGSPRM